MNLSMLMLFAPDLDRAEAFYCGALGFSRMRGDEKERVLSQGAVVLAILPCARNAPPETYAQSARPVFVFDVPVLEEARAALVAAGASAVHEQPGENGFGRYAALRDPFGTPFEILERHAQPRPKLSQAGREARPEPEIREYRVADLPGILRLCALEAWPSLTEDPARADRVLRAPGVTTMVASEGEAVLGFAQLQSDGEIQAHLSLIAVDPDHRRRGIGKALLAAGLAKAGGMRVDLVTDSADAFYAALPHRRMDGFRVYPRG